MSNKRRRCTGMTSAWLFAAALLVGCDGRTPPPATLRGCSGDTGPFFRHHEYWGGYSIEVPSSWKSGPDPNSTFQRLARACSNSDGPELDVIQFGRTFTSSTHEKRAAQSLSNIEFDWKIRDVKMQEFTTDEGVAGTEMLFYAITSRGAPESRYGMYFVEVGEVVLEVTWIGPRGRDAPYDDEILRLVKTLKIENPPPVDTEADGLRRFDEPLGGFSCVPPSGWTATAISVGPFLGYLSPDPQETLRVITVGRNPLRTVGWEDYHAKFLADYAWSFDGKHELLDKQPFITEQGLSGARLTSLVIRPSDGAELRTVVYLFEAEGGTLECQCVGNPDFGDKHDAEYDAFARSLQIETAPVGRSAQKKSGGR